MDVFKLRKNLVSDYSDYVTSFIRIKDQKIDSKVKAELDSGHLWPDPLIQLNPAYESGASVADLTSKNILHPGCEKLFNIKLHQHQEEAIRAAVNGENIVLTTGTGSGKSLTYIIPIVNYALKSNIKNKIKAIIVYPMNALANSQFGELEKFINNGAPDNIGPVTFKRYTGQESDEERQSIIANPPDILLTNYVMLELLLTRPYEKKLIEAAQDLRFLVLDELHTYRGRQGADVAMLVRRTKEQLKAEKLQFIGTSATLAAGGSFEEQQNIIANVASSLFGSQVKSNFVIGETLKPITEIRDLKDPKFIDELKNKLSDNNYKPPKTFKEFICDPLAIWIEDCFGIHFDSLDKRFVRRKPRPLTGEKGVGSDLSVITNVSVDRCIELIQQWLLAGYQCLNPINNFPVFAFRLHQFISRGDTAYSSLEKEDSRHITLEGQKFVPGSRDKILLPLAFCRLCGQEYYSVRRFHDSETNSTSFKPRELSDRLNDSESISGFLYVGTDNPWPKSDEEIIQRIPDNWLDDKQRIKRDRKNNLPETIIITTEGKKGSDGLQCNFIKAPFRFCLNCGVAYDFRQISDFAKLSTLGNEGRSTATTILCLSSLRNADLDVKSKKLLNFTDNRQDASLQAGHFNDFIEISILRGALYKAVRSSGNEGLSHENLTDRVFEAIGLQFDKYSIEPDLKYHAQNDTRRALKDILGYRLYRDLQRGWRITSPNLEQCGLLKIEYISLDELCADEPEWQKCHPALISSSASTRNKIALTLLDYMRRELAIRVNYLDPEEQERIRQRSNQRLKDPWGIDDDEVFEPYKQAIPRAQKGSAESWHVYISPRGGFGRYLRNRKTFSEYNHSLNLEDCQLIIEQLLERLKIAGIVDANDISTPDDKIFGYQLNAACMLWKVGEGKFPYLDPIRMPTRPDIDIPSNKFFVNLYSNIALESKSFRAKEHTAQVKNEDRERRELLFREGKLPILFCSPTMELGIDISELNIVGLRNMPPTPANYSQRSGRAGRSGQPALVFSYCSTGSSHDQYFFKRPDMMVSGAVAPPRLDLTNEDLIRAHIQAIWLTESGQALGSSLRDILELEGEEPTFEIQDIISDRINDLGIRERSKKKANIVLNNIKTQLLHSDWYHDNWLDEIMNQLPKSFDNACDRWRRLYQSALKQAKIQTVISQDASRSQHDRKSARRLRSEAEAQLDLLTKSSGSFQSDFYSYRYFASEGFLPGYNFPRLPLSAYIPARRKSRDNDEFISRPRFLAISEYGPRAIIYHEGSRYIINKAILPINELDEITTNEAKICSKCGYLHQINNENNRDLCESCGSLLEEIIKPLFRLQNVSTKRRDRISSDEEERVRWGYDIITGFRFAEYRHKPSYRTSEAKYMDKTLFSLKYGNAASIWRINLGWKRRVNPNQNGFILDVERGYWAKNSQVQEDPDDNISQKTTRVIPYVEDHKNCLLIHPSNDLNEEIMASLESALKQAIQIKYQLEDYELAVDPLPSRNNRKFLLYYESSEGGAGILKQIIDDTKALAEVAKIALDLCHFDKETGEDLRRSPSAQEDCEAACYDCLMNYRNQLDHEQLDRKLLKDILLELTKCEVESSPVEESRAQHLERLYRGCDTALERKWVTFLDKNDLKLPTTSQKLEEKCSTRPDFIYVDNQTVIYVDGPVHEYPSRQKRDLEQTECLENHGYTVIRFKSTDDWEEIFRKYPNIFGKF